MDPRKSRNEETFGTNKSKWNVISISVPRRFSIAPSPVPPALFLLLSASLRTEALASFLRVHRAATSLSLFPSTSLCLSKVIAILPGMYVKRSISPH